MAYQLEMLEWQELLGHEFVVVAFVAVFFVFVEEASPSFSVVLHHVPTLHDARVDVLDDAFVAYDVLQSHITQTEHGHSDGLPMLQHKILSGNGKENWQDG